MKFIKYQIMQEINMGTEEAPNIHRKLRDVVLGPMSDASFESNYAMAVSEAWNGVVEVEEVLHEETSESDAETMLLETAIDHEIRLSSLELGL